KNGRRLCLRRASRHEQAAGVGRVDGEKSITDSAGRGVEDGDVRSATGAGSGQDHAPAGAGLDRADADATGEAPIVAEEVQESDAEAFAMDGDSRSAAWSGSHDDVGGAGGVRVPGGDVDPAREAWIEGEEAVQNRAVGSVEDGNVWPAAGSGA